MATATIEQVMSLLQSGVTPLFKLTVRRGKDSRLIRVMDIDTVNLHCVFADTLKEEKFLLRLNSIKNGTFILEEVKVVIS